MCFNCLLCFRFQNTSNDTLFLDKLFSCFWCWSYHLPNNCLFSVSFVAVADCVPFWYRCFFVCLLFFEIVKLLQCQGLVLVIELWKQRDGSHGTLSSIDVVAYRSLVTRLTTGQIDHSAIRFGPLTPRHSASDCSHWALWQCSHTLWWHAVYGSIYWFSHFEIAFNILHFKKENQRNKLKHHAKNTSKRKKIVPTSTILVLIKQNQMGEKKNL